MTESLEMYLETISLLHERIRIARVTDIAQELGVSKPSVHTALHELERRGLIDHEHYGEIFLTAAGKEASAVIRRRHAVLTSFLRDCLGVSPGTAEEDACRIEHYLSDETMERISEKYELLSHAAGGGEPVNVVPALPVPEKKQRVVWVEVVPDRTRAPKNLHVVPMSGSRNSKDGGKEKPR